MVRLGSPLQIRALATSSVRPEMVTAEFYQNSSGGGTYGKQYFFSGKGFPQPVHTVKIIQYIENIILKVI